MSTSAVERLKVELCCAMRLCHRRGAGSPFIAGHASVKVSESTFLANRFGTSFATVLPEDLLLLDFDGNVLDGSGQVNQTIRLHGHIHRACSDTHAVFHSHPDCVNTFGTLGIMPAIYDQESCLLAECIAVLDKAHEALDTTTSVADIFQAQSTTLAVIAPNHGAFTRGASIEWAALHLLVLEHMCRRQLAVFALAQAVPGNVPRQIGAAAARTIRGQQTKLEALPLLWEDAMQTLLATDPELISLRNRLG